MGADSAATPYLRETRQSHHHANRSTASQQRQTVIKSAPKAPSGEIFGLALQLRFSLDVSVSCGGLMSASPEGPGDDASGLDAPLRKLHRHTPDLLNRPADQSAARRALLFIFGGGIWFA